MAERSKEAEHMGTQRAKSPGYKLWIAVGKEVGECDISLEEIGNRSFQIGQQDAERGYREPRQEELAYRVGFKLKRQQMSQRPNSRVYNEALALDIAGDLNTACEMIHQALRSEN